MNDVQTAAAAYYAAQLQESDAALEAFGARGISPDLARRLHLGYAPDGWRGLCDELNRQGYSDDVLVRSGLGMTTSRDTVVDRLRNRLIFPVKDEDRRLLGFTGRAAPGSSDSAPKYLDTCHRGVKSQVLHGLGDGRRLLEQGAVPVLCEGPLDRIAVSLTSGGRFVGLAPGGTALTAQHVAALGRVIDLRDRQVLVAFDSDEAGQRAAVAAWAPLRAAGALPDVVLLPPGSDPAQVAVDNPARLLAALERPRHLEDLVIDVKLAAWDHAHEWGVHTVGALRDAASVIVELPSVRVARQVARVSTALHVPPSEVTAAVCDALGAGTGQARGRASPGPALRAG